MHEAFHQLRSDRSDLSGSDGESDAGGLQSREGERRIKLIGRLSDSVVDRREQSRVRHSVQEMVSQRITDRRWATGI
jgi:hypothetical protein